MSIKQAIRLFIPPIIINIMKEITGSSSSWQGNYPNWDSAINYSTGYDSNLIFDKIIHSARKIRDGQTLTSQDLICFNYEYDWPLLACLMSVAAKYNNSLHVLDFGGAFGSTYMQHREFLSMLKTCIWSIVEQPHIVEAGRREFTNDVIGFYDNIDQCFASRPINIILFSAVLHYLEKPYDILNQAIRQNVDIIVDRTPVQKTERITVQHVPSKIYKASYPCRFFAKESLVKMLTKNKRQLTPWFKSYCDPDGFWGVMSCIHNKENN